MCNILLSILEEPIRDNKDSSRSDEASFVDCNGNESEKIETAESIFQRAGGELILRNCESVSKSHSFKVKGINGRIIHVKKSTMLWLLSSGRFKRSNDRLRRFQRIRTLNALPITTNRIKDDVTIGDWVALSGRLICHVSSFQYQTGENTSYKMYT